MNVVILAAGMGKRMQSALPKVLHPLAGKPLLSHVIETARSLSPAKLCVVYGHGGAAVLASLDKHKSVPGTEISAALQEPQLGTGHAVQQALPRHGHVFLAERVDERREIVEFGSFEPREDGGIFFGIGAEQEDRVGFLQMQVHAAFQMDGAGEEISGGHNHATTTFLGAGLNGTAVSCTSPVSTVCFQQID